MVEKGRTIYDNRCADCHVGSGRDSDGESPLLAGQDLNFLVTQTIAYKSGARKFPFMMDRAYRGLTDEELTSVAHYFAAQDLNTPPLTGKKKRNK